MKTKGRHFSAKREALKKVETEALDRLNSQTQVLEKKLQSKIVKVAIAGAGLLAGYAIYKVIAASQEDEGLNETDQLSSKKKKAKDLISGTMKKVITSAVPYVIEQLSPSDKATQNDSK